MDQWNQKPVFTDFLLMVIGTGLMALGIQWIYDPAGLVTGGFTGFAIIIKETTSSVVNGGIPLWLTNLLLNIPIFFISFKIIGKRFIGRSIFATVMLSVWLYIIPSMDLAKSDFTIAAVFGGAISGVGIGLVLLAKATTGGTDMVAALVQHKLRHYSVMQILMIIDGIVVLGGLYAFGLKSALYAIIAIYVTAKVSDALMEGLKFSKAAYIITDHHKEVAAALMKELDRGVTGLDAEGMFSGDKKCMLFCVVSKKEIVELKDIVVNIDKNAFVIVTDAREVLGEGFIEYGLK